MQPINVSCPRCQIGLMKRVKSTYSAIHQGMLVSVPDMPGMQCDICSYQEYHPSALIRLGAQLRRFNLPEAYAGSAFANLPAQEGETAENKPVRRPKP